MFVNIFSRNGQNDIISIFAQFIALPSRNT